MYVDIKLINEYCVRFCTGQTRVLTIVIDRNGPENRSC